MKLTLTSRALRWLGNTLIGTPETLFGIPKGALEDFYVAPNDRDAPVNKEWNTTSWQHRKLFEVGLRRYIAPKIGLLTSALSTAIVVVGLLAFASTSGLHSLVAKHEAAAKAARAEAKVIDTAKEKCDEAHKQAATLDTWSKQQLASQGCDVSSGDLDVDKFKAFLEGRQ